MTAGGGDMDEGEFGSLLEGVYQMALEPESWPGLVDRIAGVFGGHAGALMHENLETRFGGGVVRGLPDEAPGQYFNYYAARNVLRPVSNARELMRRFEPTITVDQESLPKSELIRTEFYNDFLRPTGIHSVMTMGLWGQEVDVATIDVYRPLGRPDFDEAELTLAWRLHPHLVRAFSLSRRMADALAVRDGLAAAVDRAPYGFFVLGADRRPRHVNTLGERLLARGGGLGLVSGRLVAPTSAETARLEALVAAACAPVGPRVGGSMAIRRTDGRAPLAVTISPCDGGLVSLFSSGPSAVVCVSDPDAVQSVSEVQLREVFGLTAAQARVATAIFEGKSPREAAQALGLSFFTVRAHLARVFEKTGVNRQAELVALITRLIGPAG